MLCLGSFLLIGMSINVSGAENILTDSKPMGRMTSWMNLDKYDEKQKVYPVCRPTCRPIRQDRLKSR